MLDIKTECKALIFDVDGTLAETEELHRKAFNLTFKKLCVNWYWDRICYKKLLNTSGGVERLLHYKNLARDESSTLTNEIIDKIHSKKTAIYTQSIKNTKLELRPGVAKLIKEAQTKNIKLALATATSLVNVRALAKNIWGKPVSRIFHAVATGDEVSNKKPSPEVYELILRKLQIESKDCIAVEDSLNGLKSAKAAGLKTVITPSLYTKNDDFSLADIVLPSLVGFKLQES